MGRRLQAITSEVVRQTEFSELKLRGEVWDDHRLSETNELCLQSQGTTGRSIDCGWLIAVVGLRGGLQTFTYGRNVT
jgi:hypothetical protein